ncbi:MAG: succinate dehydrogenase iron-sulfur subunit [Parachlamydiales bacterium]|nr:succinate dehydrogenase iron-sulfur subunit [Parachlamydiales bacterium]
MKYTLKIYRGIKDKQYFEEFELDYVEGSNVISALLQIQKNPITKLGNKTTPVSFEMGCLEEVCGACSMLINSIPRQACTALIKDLLEKSDTITLAPLSKFELIKDLVVDRKNLFDLLKKANAFVKIDPKEINSFGPKIDHNLRDSLYVLSKCMSCGCCMEACPQYNSHSKFVGPFVISQVRLFNSHPLGKKQKAERLNLMLEDGGISDCGNAQNCKEVCPKEIPLTESIAKIGREATIESFKSVFSKKKS